MLRWLLVAGGVLTALPVVATLVLRQIDVTSPRLVAYVAGTPVVLAAGVASIVLFALGRSHIGIATAVVLTVILGLTQVPLYVGTAAAPDGAARFTVMTVNLLYGDADADEIVATVRERGVDVLATQELTNPAVRALRAAGLEDVLPHAELHPGGAHGNGLWSRVPLSSAAVPSGFDNPPVAATAQVGGRPILLACVHPISPYPDDTARWDSELDRLRDWLAGVDGPAIVAGDFNATPDHRQFRALLTAGYADAAAQVGAGWLPTFPANRRRIPLLITIDHVLVSPGIVATSLDRLEIAGTDHAALIATVAVPPS